MSFKLKPISIHMEVIHNHHNHIPLIGRNSHVHILTSYNNIPRGIQETNCNKNIRDKNNIHFLVNYMLSLLLEGLHQRQFEGKINFCVIDSENYLF